MTMTREHHEQAQGDQAVVVHIQNSNQGWFGLDGHHYKIISTVRGAPAQMSRLVGLISQRSLNSMSNKRPRSSLPEQSSEKLPKNVDRAQVPMGVVSSIIAVIVESAVPVTERPDALAGASVTWVEADPNRPGEALAAAVRAFDAPEGDGLVWVACEAVAVRIGIQRVRTERNLISVRQPIKDTFALRQESPEDQDDPFRTGGDQTGNGPVLRDHIVELREPKVVEKNSKINPAHKTSSNRACPSCGRLFQVRGRGMQRSAAGRKILHGKTQIRCAPSHNHSGTAS